MMGGRSKLKKNPWSKLTVFCMKVPSVSLMTRPASIPKAVNPHHISPTASEANLQIWIAPSRALLGFSYAVAYNLRIRR